MAVRKKKNFRKKPTPRRQQKKFVRFEEMLENFLLEMVVGLQKDVKATLLPRIELLAETAKSKEAQKTKAPVIRFDAPSDGETMENLIDVVEAQFLGRFSRAFIAKNISEFYSQVNLAATDETIREFAAQQIAVTPSGDVKTVIENAVRTSVAKIEDLKRTTLGNIRAKVSEAVVTGTRWESLAKDLSSDIAEKDKGTFKTAANRAKFIARNEVTSTLGAVNKEQQESAGIELYEWQTAEDERVRPTHRDLNGRIFSWEGQPEVNGVVYNEAIDPAYSSSGTIPGQPWNCRCVAIPFIEEVEGI